MCVAKRFFSLETGKQVEANNHNRTVVQKYQFKLKMSRIHSIDEHVCASFNFLCFFWFLFLLLKDNMSGFSFFWMEIKNSKEIEIFLSKILGFFFHYFNVWVTHLYLIRIFAFFCTYQELYFKYLKKKRNKTKHSPTLCLKVSTIFNIFSLIVKI